MLPIGETVRATHHVTAPTDTVYYSPWFPRGGNKAVFACEVINLKDLASFNIDVETKAAEDSDVNTSIKTPQGGSSVSITLTANTITTFTVGSKLSDTTNQGFKDLVRFKYRVKSSTNKHGWVHFRILNPAWLTN